MEIVPPKQICGVILSDCNEMQEGLRWMDRERQLWVSSSHPVKSDNDGKASEVNDAGLCGNEPAIYCSSWGMIVQVQDRVKRLMIRDAGLT